MKRLTAILILAFVSVALFADVPFTAELAEKLDSIICNSKEFQNKYDGYIIWATPKGRDTFYSAARHYSSMKDFHENYGNKIRLVYVIGVVNNHGRAELTTTAYYFAKTDNEGDISHYKYPKPQIANARRLLDYDIACEPTWF